MYYRNINGVAPMHIGYFEQDPLLKLDDNIIFTIVC